MIGHVPTTSWDIVIVGAACRNAIEHMKKTGGSGADALCMAEVLAYQGRYTDAAKMFTKAGALER